MSAEVVSAGDQISGAASPYPDTATAELALLVRWWVRFDKMQRGMQTANQPEKLIEPVQKIVAAYKRQIDKALRAHPLWLWLEGKAGLRGPYTAWIIARIRDPRRFPGQKCNAGHYLPAIYQPGTPCPIGQCVEDDTVTERCGVPVLPPRQGTGVRSVWHYFGLHVVNGRRAHKAKGKKADWVTEAGGILLGPQGLADQIVMHSPDPYRGIYDYHHERLTYARGAAQQIEDEQELGADSTCEIDGIDGAETLPEVEVSDGAAGGAEAGVGVESEILPGLRPFEVHRRARTIAVKAFVGDLLMEWKRLMPPYAEASDANDYETGDPAA